MHVAPPRHQALQEMRDAVDIAASLNRGRHESYHPSEVLPDHKSTFDSTSLSSHNASDILLKVTPETLDEIKELTDIRVKPDVHIREIKNLKDASLEKEESGENSELTAVWIEKEESGENSELTAGRIEKEESGEKSELTEARLGKEESGQRTTCLRSD
ncbi:hypothetical protein NDU88_005981 [Pleurodeles waltl]|uniref:Uncharacterized protein n=1 Tax=Pleurodeles waltl TaxID=8319 RepID=A0AAV7NY29_PLEWA|nr:hypothetical protein NDU88_005981 [Pleurodeles waltl]